MSPSYEPQNPNTKLYLLAKRFQDWSPIITVVISCLALVIIGVQACIYWKQAAIMDKGLGAANTSARAAEESAKAAKEALRPYLSIAEIKIDTFRPDKPIALFILWKNDGNTPTTITKSITWVAISSDVPTESSCKEGTDVTQPFVVTPHNTKPQTVEARFNAAEIQDVIDRHKYFWFCGRVVYQSLGKEESFPLCSYSTGNLSLFRECKKG